MKYDVNCGIVAYGLYYIEEGFLYAHFLEIYYHKSIINFVKCFFSIYWDDHMGFILQFVNVVYHSDWFVDIEKSLHMWDKSNLIMVYGILLVFLLRIFVSMFISDIGL